MSQWFATGRSTTKTAGARGDLPEGLTFDEPHQIQYQGTRRAVLARHDGKLVGSMQWHHDGEISDVRVHPEYRRRGVASAMWDYAHSRDEYDVKPKHSTNRSDSGDAWARTHGAEERDRGHGADESYADQHWASKTAAGDWYHGTDANFDRFDLDPQSKGAGSFGGTKKHWNCHIGPHFTSEHHTANNLADNAGAIKETPNYEGQVYHCSLAMKNPKHYDSEFDMDKHAARWANEAGYNGISTTIKAEHHLRMHPEVKAIASGFKEHLKSKGHDGITYGNEFEGTNGHKCAIAFHPDDVTIDSRHSSHDDCGTDRICGQCLRHNGDGAANCEACDTDLSEHDDPFHGMSAEDKARHEEIGKMFGSLTRHFAQTYYHGTDAELDPGTKLEPASKRYPDMSPSHHTWDRVSITTDPEEARAYGDHVYEVHPHGDMQVDPEYSASGIGFHVPGATVTTRHFANAPNYNDQGRLAPFNFKGHEPEQGQHRYFRGLHLGHETYRTAKPEGERSGGWLPDQTDPSHWVEHTRSTHPQAVQKAIREHMQAQHDRGLIDLDHPEISKDVKGSFGRHWTTDPSMAHQFAHDTSHGKYRGGVVSHHGPTIGAIVELHSTEEPTRTSDHYGEAETEPPLRKHLTKAWLHVVRHDPNLEAPRQVEPHPWAGTDKAQPTEVSHYQQNTVVHTVPIDLHDPSVAPGGLTKPSLGKQAAVQHREFDGKKYIEPHMPYEHPKHVYVRFGDWRDDERSTNYVTGAKEDGVSVYHMDHEGHPIDPDPHMERGHHEHSDWCGHDEGDCHQPEYDEEFGNDTREEMQGRVHKAERVFRNGVWDAKNARGHLVTGDHNGFGHDGEPVLRNLKRVGDWVAHRHLFVQGAEPHHLLKDHTEEDEEERKDYHSSDFDEDVDRDVAEVHGVKKQAANITGNDALDDATDWWEGDGSMEITHAAAHHLNGPKGWESSPPPAGHNPIVDERWKDALGVSKTLMDHSKRFHHPVWHGTGELRDHKVGEHFTIPLMAATSDKEVADGFSQSMRWGEHGEPAPDDVVHYHFPKGGHGVQINSQEHVVTGQYRVHSVHSNEVTLHPVSETQAHPGVAKQAYGTDAMGDQDWDEIHPDLPDTVHRGVGVNLPDDLHRFVHDNSKPTEDRAKALVRHLHTQEARGDHDGRAGGVGTSWSGDHSVAEDFSVTNADHHTDNNQRHADQHEDATWGKVRVKHEDGDYDEHVGKPGTAVMLHAHTPERHEIDDNPNGDGSGMRYTYHGHGEQEVPVQGGTGMRIKGVSWRPVLPMEHPDYVTDKGEFTHHEFKEPIHAQANFVAPPHPDWDDDEDEPEDKDADRDENGDCHYYPAHDHEHEDMGYQDGEGKRCPYATQHTPWDEIHPGLGDIHRGLGLTVPKDLHEHAHSDAPLHERAKAISDHISGDHLGMHWSADPEQSHEYAHRNLRDDYSHGGSSDRLAVVVHAHKPEMHHIEQDPDNLHDRNVIGFEHHDDAEVPLKGGAPIKVKAISWLKDDAHSLANSHLSDSWNHHEFGTAEQHVAKRAVPAYDGGHEATRGEGHPPGRPGLGEPGFRDEGPGAIARRVRAGLRRRAVEGPGARRLTLHPKAEKDIRSLDRPVQKQIRTTIESIRSGDENTLAQTHPLKGSLKGWFSTKASRGHRVVHQPTDDGGLHIGYVGLHEYGEAERRLSARA